MSLSKKVKFKVWMIVEKQTTNEKGQETFEDLKHLQISVSEFKTAKDAVATMEMIHTNYFTFAEAE